MCSRVIAASLAGARIMRSTTANLRRITLAIDSSTRQQKASSRSGACPPRRRLASTRLIRRRWNAEKAHLWSGRFAGDPDAALFEFGASFSFDRRLFEDDVKGSIGWAQALHEARVLSSADAAKIKHALE